MYVCMYVSSIDELGHRCLKVGGDGQCSAPKEITMATLQAVTTGTITLRKTQRNTYMYQPELTKSELNHREGGLGNNSKTKLAPQSKTC